MSRMWRYTLFSLVLWIVNPEIRRLWDWRFGFSQIEPVSLLSLFSALPYLWLLTFGGAWRRLPRPLVFAAWTWVGAFSYGFFLAILSGNTLPATYAFANFILPLGLALWIAADDTEFSVAYARITKTLFTVTTVVSIYGIIQYLILPPWDAYWLTSVTEQGAHSFGLSFPYKVRVFSMLSSPGPFGNYLGAMLLMSLPELALQRPKLVAQIPLWLIAFGLSLDRSGWLMFALGLGVYLLFTSRRRAAFTAILASLLLLMGSASLLSVTIGNDAILASISQRLDTFSDLNSDRSANDRQGVYADGIQQLLDAPFGRGLGVVGTSTKLTKTAWTTDFDSGVLARLIELGIPGFILLSWSIVLLLSLLFNFWKISKKSRNTKTQDIMAMTLAGVIGLIALELSGDVTGLLLLILWVLPCLATHLGEPRRESPVQWKLQMQNG